MVEMMCKLGHYASKEQLKKLKMKQKLRQQKIVNVIPFEMSLNASTVTGVAWDNFDRFVETESGKGRLHHTVGVAYQVLNNS